MIIQMTLVHFHDAASSQDGPLVLVRKVRKETKASYQTTLGECLKKKEGWIRVQLEGRGLSA
jgi:hypothetical protein